MVDHGGSWGTMVVHGRPCSSWSTMVEHGEFRHHHTLVLLQVVDISNNNIGPQGFRTLMLSMCHNFTITSLNVASNMADTDSAVSESAAIAYYHFRILCTIPTYVAEVRVHLRSSLHKAKLSEKHVVKAWR